MFFMPLSLLIGALILLSVEFSSVHAANPKPEGDYVVLLHGLGRTALSMKRLEYYFKEHGYRVVNVTYPSTRFSVEELADVHLDRQLRQAISDPAARIHFVTHSLGGVILRRYLSNHTVQNLGRVVMIAPPNHGSDLIDHLKNSALARKFLGPGALELGTDPHSILNRLAPLDFECGVIAGDQSLNPFFSRLLKGPNDGKVTVDSARVDGMRDFLVLHSSHTWLIWRKQTLEQALCFLESGHFKPNNRPAKHAACSCTGI
jgi:triacylglycerol lipase